VVVAALRFALVDVFSDTPLAGNPLAVVLGGEELPDATLLAIAREFNQAETTFVLPPRLEGATRRLRSFTAGGSEVGGAGHNALGAWWWLVAEGHVRAGSLRQEIGGSLLALDVVERSGRIEVRMTQGPPKLGARLDELDPIAAALRLRRDALAPAPQVVSTDVPHLLVRARDRTSVDAARPESEALAAVLADARAEGCYLFAMDPIDAAATAHARFFNPTVGLWEDVATGTAAGPLAWWLHQGDGAPRTLVIEQGYALGRPSRLQIEVEGDRVTLVGSAALAADGTLHAPA
jgi:PhzF family phenazine biosynthesis protein